MLEVGFDQFAYLHEKAIHGSRPPGVRHVKVQRLPLERLMPDAAWADAAFQCYVPIPFIRQEPGGPRRLALGRGVDLYHCYNRVSFGLRPWGVTFESYLPRFFLKPPDSWIYREACRRLASPRCRFIVGLSQMARRTFEAGNPALAAEVAGKTSVMYPLQSEFATREAVEAKWAAPRPRPLRCLFVGNEFFRKGGLPLLRAVQRLHDSGAEIRLDVVSSLEANDYVTGAGEREIAEVRERLARGPFTFRSHVPNAEVLALMDEADLFVLPTLDDSFGMVVIEAMARGTPVLSTDVRALPEINPSAIGLVLELPRGTRKPEHWIGLEHEPGSRARAAALAEAETLLEDGIVAAIERILAGREDLGARALAAHAFARERFGAERHAAELIALYRQAMGG
jgi:glycosyltransferase involved in cell wall biosynthesis